MNFEKVRDIIDETIHCGTEVITPDAKLKETLGIDSLDAVELNLALEEAFGASIDDETLMGFVTVQDIVSYIDAL